MYDIHLPTDEAARGEILRAAKMATLNRSANTDEALALEHELLRLTLSYEQAHGRRKRRRNAEAEKSLRKTISAFAADLVLGASNTEAKGYVYRSLDKLELQETEVSIRQFDALRAAWAAEGLIEIAKGFRGQTDFDGDPIDGPSFASRFRATPRLLGIALKHGIAPENISDHYTQVSGSMFPIILRKAKKRERSKSKPIKFERTDAVLALADEVREINEYLQTHRYNLFEPPFLRRIFNNGDLPEFEWDQGGRLYACGDVDFQRLKSEERRQIRIDGQPTVEIDIQSSQLTLAYGLASLDLPEGDLYATEGLPRAVVKSLVTAYLGKGSEPKRWPDKLAGEYHSANGRPISKDYRLKECVEIVCHKHPILPKLASFKIDVFKLQFVESQILMKTLLELKRHHDVPALPIFDCIIVKEEDFHTGRAVMGRKFYEETGIWPTLIQKPSLCDNP